MMSVLVGGEDLVPEVPKVLTDQTTSREWYAKKRLGSMKKAELIELCHWFQVMLQGSDLVVKALREKEKEIVTTRASYKIACDRIKVLGGNIAHADKNIATLDALVSNQAAVITFLADNLESAMSRAQDLVSQDKLVAGSRKLNQILHSETANILFSELEVLCRVAEGSRLKK